MFKNDTFNDAYLSIIKDDNKQENQKSRLDQLIQQYQNLEVPTKQDIINLLNIAIMDEYLAEYNYFASYNLSKTEGKADFDPEFQQHEDEERGHRKDIVNRLRELDVPVPTKLLQEYLTLNSSGQNWKQELSQDSYEIIKNRYQEELDAVKFYGMIFATLRKLPNDQRDTTTEMLIKHIKADEEAHAKDLRDLMVEHGLLDINGNQNGEEVNEKQTAEDEQMTDSDQQALNMNMDNNESQEE